MVGVSNFDDKTLQQVFPSGGSPPLEGFIYARNIVSPEANSITIEIVIGDQRQLSHRGNHIGTYDG
jgi:hypothetical protein